MECDRKGDRNVRVPKPRRNPTFRRRRFGCGQSLLRIVAMAIAAQACAALLIGCTSSMRTPALTYVSPASSEPTARAVHRALESMQYAISDTSHDSRNNYVITSFDRDGNKITVIVAPSEGQSTHLNVSVVPGENDAIRQQIIRVIDREVRR